MKHNGKIKLDNLELLILFCKKMDPKLFWNVFELDQETTVKILTVRITGYLEVTDRLPEDSLLELNREDMVWPKRKK
jgi:hypothetical protein